MKLLSVPTSRKPQYFTPALVTLGEVSTFNNPKVNKGVIITHATESYIFDSITFRELFILLIGISQAFYIRIERIYKVS